ncbi:MAG: hypothetical protein HQL40_01705, partial [Alphaproteobacteria bacterium]|nr:hypothetical protein [Alphaproteobacteria bacterium]
SVGAAISRFDERPGAELEIGIEDGDTEYLLRLGAGWSGEPAMDAAEASVDDGIDLSLTVNHALSPDVFVAGMAGAGRDRTDGDEPDRFRFGAGLGLRF